MIPGAHVRDRRSFLLALVISALLAGLVGMHHLAPVDDDRASTDVSSVGTVSDDHRTSVAPRPDSPGVDHATALLRLCWAVLTAIAAIVVPLLLSWGRAPVFSASMFRAVRAESAPRAPPDGAPARLAL